MKPPVPPRLDRRRTREFAAELQARARTWIPDWVVDDDTDFGRALLQVAARFSAEVAEQLDGAGGKLRDGLFDWLGVHGEAARPARVPLAFKLGDKAIDAVLAPTQTRLQADVDGTSVVFETETDVRLVPSKLVRIVGVEADHFYLPPPGLASLEPVQPLPDQWSLRSFAAPDAETLQLDPGEGLLPETVLQSGDQRVRITQEDQGLATIAPPLRDGLGPGAVVAKVVEFSPFDARWTDEQEHALYFGSTELLDISAAATLDILGAQRLAGVAWEYWGKKKQSKTPDAVKWQAFDIPDVQPFANALTLVKPEGAVEVREIAGKSARWIRAFARQAEPPTFGVDQLSIRVNYTPLTTTCQNVAGKPSVEFEAMSNTTPLVVDSAFYPLGREPRQFDAFYIASAEAFSKTDARVQLCFEMADLSFQGFVCLHSGQNGNKVLAGVTRDGGLQLLGFDPGTGQLSRYRNRPPLRPPSPGANGATVDGAPIALRAGPMAIWDDGANFVVAVAAGDAVWCWREMDAEEGRLSGWKQLPDVPVVQPATGQAPAVDTFVHLATPKVLLATRDAKLYACDPDADTPAWTSVAAKHGASGVELTRIAPIFVAAAATVPERLVGVARDLSLYAVNVDDSAQQADCTLLRLGVDPEVTPAAILHANNTLVAVAVGPGTGGRSLLGFQSTVAALAQNDVAEAALGTAQVLGEAIDAAVVNAHGVFAMCLASTDGTTRLARWSPFEPALSKLMFSTPIPTGMGPAAGAPAVMPAHLIVPVLSSQVLVAAFDPHTSTKRTAPLKTAIITRSGDPLVAGDRAAFPGTFDYELATAETPVQQGGNTLFPFNVHATEGDIFVYRAVDPTWQSAVDAMALDTVKILGNPPITPGHTRLLITTTQSTDTYRVDAFDAITHIAKLDRKLNVLNPPPAGDQVTCQLPAPAPVPDHRRVVPVLELDSLSGDWDAGWLDRTLLAFEGADPTWQKGHAFQVDGNGHPLWVDLASPWTSPPATVPVQVEFFVDTAVQPWAGRLADTTSNPALSWEYWNGTGWWSLGANDAGTQHLKRSGAITFQVPADLRPTDWSGKTSYWIRARLIGGDYGREEVTVVTTPPPPANQTRQTIERNPDNIRAPYVARLHVSYAMEKGVLPTFVLAQDSGSIRDQSDANRTPNAIVEAFVPLPILLARLSRQGARSDDTVCEPECECRGAEVSDDAQAMASSPEDASAATATRALFLGFKGPLSGGPVRLYLRLLEQQAQDAHAALSVDALVADRFVPLVVQDETRGLGESGMLTLAFDAQPTPRELFGATLRWLRITPSGDASAWAPILQGAYLNAAWATAAETMTYERLGSSDGAPHQVLALARPPVLRDTLELRVREPLGDEERAILIEHAPTSVVRDPPGLPGDWVRWKQVFDPADQAASERVYSLDEATGEIVFGDGQHGMIPPVGSDSIAAFRYQRTARAADGSDRVPANEVAARAQLNLVSPVSGVEAVYAADQAAGGAPPESPSRILRFGGARLRHRNRAISTSDLEDIALQSSPDIAQARAFAARGNVRLVVVMRGSNATPDLAQRRELERLLLGVSPASMGALRIAGPTLRALGARLRLRVNSLDDTGAVEQVVRARIAAWFDAVTGGADGEGWPLGRSPDASDIALALVDAPRLAGVVDVVLHEVVDALLERPWPASLRADYLVDLRDDAWHLAFDTGEEGT